MLTLTSIHLYPIKSAGGLAPVEWEVDSFGLHLDRRWMVVDSAGEFLSQRRHPRLALVRPVIRDGGLEVQAPGMPPLQVPSPRGEGVTTTGFIWGDACEVLWQGERPARWFSELLGCDCSLVYMPDRTIRPADQEFAPADTRVSFADAYPFLLISEESLADLNSRMSLPLPMNRFRPNLVIAGGAPFAEDRLPEFWLGDIRFRAVKPCDRCVLTTTDQETAQRGQEPLRTLASFRKFDGKVLFGQNLVHWGTGRLRVGTALRL